jgi:predicted phosphodiesterase
MGTYQRVGAWAFEERAPLGCPLQIISAVTLTPTDPVLILSDLHLGHRASRIDDASHLEALIRPFRTAIFNGDTAELWHAADRPRGRKLTADLARFCHHVGCKAIFINGNHDPDISEVNHLDLHNGALLVTHGDILFLGVAPWSKDAKQYLSAHRRILKDLGEDALGSFEHQLLATKRASLELQMWENPVHGGSLAGLSLLALQAWPPNHLFKILHAWWQTPSLAVDLMKLFRPQAQVVLIGHTHHPGVWRRSGRIIVNTGSFLNYMRAQAAIIEGERLEVRWVNERNGNFTLGKVKEVFKIPKAGVQELQEFGSSGTIRSALTTGH